jgi:hypothetical protein
MCNKAKRSIKVMLDAYNELNYISEDHEEICDAKSMEGKSR